MFNEKLINFSIEVKQFSYLLTNKYLLSFKIEHKDVKDLQRKLSQVKLVTTDPEASGTESEWSKSTVESKTRSDCNL